MTPATLTVSRRKLFSPIGTKVSNSNVPCYRFIGSVRTREGTFGAGAKESERLSILFFFPLVSAARSERYHHLETEEDDTNDEDFNVELRQFSSCSHRFSKVSAAKIGPVFLSHVESGGRGNSMRPPFVKLLAMVMIETCVGVNDVCA